MFDKIGELSFNTKVLMRWGWTVVQENHAFHLNKPNGQLYLSMHTIQNAEYATKYLWDRAPDITEDLGLAMELPHKFLTLEITEQRDGKYEITYRNYFGLIERMRQCDTLREVPITICKVWWNWLEEKIGPWNSLEKEIGL